MKKIINICLSAGIQKTVCFDKISKGKVNRSSFYRYDVAGKAVNCARVLSQLIQTEHVEKMFKTTVICPLGEKNISLWNEISKDETFFQNTLTIPGYTRECCTIIDSTDNSTTELIFEEPADFTASKDLHNQLVQIVENELNTDEPVALIMAGKRPAIWEAYILKKIAELAKSKNALFMADFKGDDLVSLIPEFSPDIIKINEEEFTSTFAGGQTLKGDIELADTISEKSQFLHNKIIVTRGGEKTIAADCGKLFYCDTEKIKLLNTTGCGDSFNAGFAFEYVQSEDFEKALKKGTWCASRNAEVLRPGSIK